MPKYFSLLFIFIITLTNTTFAQNDVSKSVEELYNRNIDNTTEALKNGEKMLQLSKTPQDSLLSHMVIGDLKDKQLEYRDAIKHYKKATEISLRLKDYNNTVKANTLLTLTYWNSGLKSKYKQAWNEVKKYSNKASNYESFKYQYNTWLLEEEGKYCEAIKDAENNLNEIQTKADFSKPENNIHLAAFMCGSAFYLLKCNDNNNFSKGKEYIAKVENLIKKYSTFESFYYAQKYFLCKALIAHQEKDKQNTIYWFKKALDISIHQENYRSMSMIMDEGEKIGITSNDLQYASKFINLLNKKNKEISEISNEEISDKETEILKEKKNYKSILTIASIIIFGSIVLVIQNINAKKKTKKRFEEIIKQLQLESQNTNIQIDENSDQKAVINQKISIKLSERNRPNDLKRIMSEEKEAELVKKLITFEKGKEYRDNNFTISNMASLFETNTKYLNYIISSQRNMNFNDYINHLRIKHLVEKLYNDPSFLNYKISYLSEYSGFSSHSRFTQIFKKELDISPSDFIENLRKTRS